jgi:hypothetical protein
MWQSLQRILVPKLWLMCLALLRHAVLRCCAVLCCAQVGFESFGTDLAEDVSQEQLLKVVADYNADPKVGYECAAVPASHSQSRAQVM